MPSLRSLVVVLAAAACVVGSSAPASADVSSITASPVTVYGAKWCPACRSLENGLRERKIAFDMVDVDESPAAFARARTAAGATGAIPLTSIVKSSKTVWVVGADVEAVDRAQKGE